MRIFSFITVFILSVSSAFAAPAEKDWTLLVFLNGNNNLDRFGAMDINEMEKVGSTDSVNVVVQWASMAASSVKRLYVKKDNNPNKVTSPTVQDMGAVDMGDVKSLVEFVRWGAQNYPAKHYFIDVWNHGAGWHRLSLDGGFKPTDISWDDKTGNFITTEQLGDAMKQAAAIIGHKVDVYGSDACLMAMAEVANEMNDSVSYYVGSQETEPGEGWPYDGLLTRWNATPNATGADVGKILTEEYVKSYEKGGSQAGSGSQETTFSAFDLGQMDTLNKAVEELAKKILSSDAAELTKIKNSADSSQSYAYSDYKDLSDFTTEMEKSQVRIEPATLKGVRDAIGKFVIATRSSKDYVRSKGVSIWLPTSSYTYQSYSQRYSGLHFAKATNWNGALEGLLK